MCFYEALHPEQEEETRSLVCLLGDRNDEQKKVVPYIFGGFSNMFAAERRMNNSRKAANTAKVPQLDVGISRASTPVQTKIPVRIEIFHRNFGPKFSIFNAVYALIMVSIIMNEKHSTSR